MNCYNFHHNNENSISPISFPQNLYTYLPTLVLYTYLPNSIIVKKSKKILSMCISSSYSFSLDIQYINTTQKKIKGKIYLSEQRTLWTVITLPLPFSVSETKIFLPSSKYNPLSTLPKLLTPFQNPYILINPSIPQNILIQYSLFLNC